MMNDSKNLISAIVLSIIVMLAWQYFVVVPQVQEQQKVASESKIVNNTVEISDIGEVVEGKVARSTFIDRKEALQNSGRVKIFTDKLQGSISLKGARFDDLTLRKYKLYNVDKSPNVSLLSPANTKSAYFGEFNWLAKDRQVKTPDVNSVWVADKDVLRVDSPISMSWDNGDGLKFFIDVTIDENYMFKLVRRVENYGYKSVTLMPYGIFSRTKDMSVQSFFILHEGALGVMDGILNEVRFDDLKDDKKVEYKNSRGWIGVTDKYWLTALVPDQENSFDANFTYFYKNGQDRFQIDYLGQDRDVNPGDEIVITNRFFAGEYFA